jgi:sec-independent protein translocase protein TatB
MFDIGFSELVVIGLIALIVLGPQRLPEVARTAGRWVGKARRFVENVKRDLDEEINSEDLAAFKEMHQELSETRGLLQKTATDTLSNFSEVQTEMQSVVAQPPEAPAAELPAPVAEAPLSPPVAEKKRKPRTAPVKKAAPATKRSVRKTASPAKKSSKASDVDE